MKKLCIHKPLMIQFTTEHMLSCTEQGWGLLSQYSPFRFFPNFSDWSKHSLFVWYNGHIWQVSPQLSCRDIWQIWTWLKVYKLYFGLIKISRNGEINERSFSNPHSRTTHSGAIVVIILEKKGHPMAADALAPGITRKSEAMILAHIYASLKQLSTERVKPSIHLPLITWHFTCPHEIICHQPSPVH